MTSFNEAAGIHRRKPEVDYEFAERAWYFASMRPPEFTGGNTTPVRNSTLSGIFASMRPPEFTGGNAREGGRDRRQGHGASMRPPEFTGGNGLDLSGSRAPGSLASMRPPEFTGGNALVIDASRTSTRGGFNEAAGIHRRKLVEELQYLRDARVLQ